MNLFRSRILFLTVILGLFAHCDGAKILFFFGGGSYSHKQSVWPWVVEMAKSHEVTFLSPHEKKPMDSPEIRDISSPLLQKVMSSTYDIDRFEDRRLGKENIMLDTYHNVVPMLCEVTLLQSKDEPTLHRLIYNETFDLVIVNSIYGECGFIVAHHYRNARVIAFDASVPLVWFPDVYGYIPTTSLIPDIRRKFDNIPFSFMDKVYNYLYSMRWYMERKFLMHPQLDRVARLAFPEEDNIPSFQDMERNVSFVFVNTHPASDFAYTLPPHLVQLGGMSNWLPEKEIPKVYQAFLDGAGPEGVVYISFGSTIRLEKVNPYYSQIFFELIKKHPDVRFLMKWSGPLPKAYENQLDNLMVSDWTPQREILRHLNIKAFISHGGLNSIHEATYYGVPMIVLPLFSDQDYNAYRIEVQQVGFRIEIKELSLPLMDEALHKLLTNPMYKKNMAIKSRIFRDRPLSPIQTAVYWTEYALRHPDVSSFRPMDAHLSFIQRRMIDVVLFIGGIVTTTIITLIYVTLRVLRIVSRPRQKVKRS